MKKPILIEVQKQGTLDNIVININHISMIENKKEKAFIHILNKVPFLIESSYEGFLDRITNIFNPTN